MSKLTDADLQALADAQGDAGDRARLQALLAEDPGAQREVERIRALNASLRAAFPEPDPTTGARFEDLVRAAPLEHSKVVSFRPRPTSWMTGIAAAAMFAVTLGAGYFAGVTGRSEGGLDLVAIDARHPLYAAVNATPSGETASLDNGGQVKPILTFQAQDGRYCREIEFDFGASASVGIVCREQDAWRMMVMAAAEGAPSTTNGYAPVGETASAVLNTYFRTLEASDPLPPQVEAELIGAGWD